MTQVQNFFLLLITLGTIHYTSTWKISNGNFTCAVLDGFISVSMKYKNVNDQITHKFFEFPNNRSDLRVFANGMCTTNDDPIGITVSRFKGGEYPPKNEITFVFGKVPQWKYAIVSVSVKIESDDVGKVLDASSPNHLALFPTDIDSTYSSDIATINLTRGWSVDKYQEVEMEVAITKFRYRAFIKPKPQEQSSEISLSNADIGWKVKDKTTNQTCLVMNAVINLSINYTNNAGQIKHTNVEFTPINPYCEGSCQTKFGDQTILIIGSVSPLTTITFLFQRADTDYERVGEVPSGKYYIAEISASTHVMDLPNSLLEIEAKRLVLFPTPYGSAFSSPLEKVSIKDEIHKGKAEVEVTFKDVQFQAFIKGEKADMNVVPSKKDAGYDNDGLGVQNGSKKLGTGQLAIVVAFISVILRY